MSNAYTFIFNLYIFYRKQDSSMKAAGSFRRGDADVLKRNTRDTEPGRERLGHSLAPSSCWSVEDVIIKQCNNTVAYIAKTNRSKPGKKKDTSLRRKAESPTGDCGTHNTPMRRGIRNQKREQACIDTRTSAPTGAYCTYIDFERSFPQFVGIKKANHVYRNSVLNDD